MRVLPVAASLGLVVAACVSTQPITVEGVVIAVDGDLTSVRSFDVLTTDSETLRFVPVPFGDFAFPPPHLGAHMRSLEPVRVTYRDVGDEVLLADAIEDAESGGTP